MACLTHGFDRGGRGGAGFGLALHIADTIARQAGGRLDPVPDRPCFVATSRSLPG